MIDAWANKDRNKLAMIWVNQEGVEEKFTFWDLMRLSNQIVNIMIKYRVDKGDRVLIMLPQLPEWWTFTLALIKRGAVYCPAPTMLTSHDLKYRINIADIKMVITSQERAEKIDEIARECPSLSCKAMSRLGGSGSFRIAGNPPPNQPPKSFLQRLNDLLKWGPARVDYVLFDRRRIDDTVVKALIDVGEIGDLTLLDCELACSPDAGSVSVVGKLDLAQCKGTAGLLRMCDVSRIESLDLNDSDAGDDVCDTLASAAN